LENLTRKILLVCFFALALGFPCKSQTDFVQQAYTLLQEGNVNEARVYIDSSLNDLRYFNDAQAWYLRGHIYKTIYNKNEKGNPTSPSRITALKSYTKSIELDTSIENRSENLKSIKYLSSTLYNDAASNMDTLNYKIAIKDFGIFKDYYELYENSKSVRTEMEIKFKLALATVLSQLFENNNNAQKYYILTMKLYDEILELDPENKNAFHNKMVMRFNKTDREQKAEKEKMQNEIELKSSKISLLDKENELKKMNLKEQQYQIETQKLQNDKTEKEVSLLNKDNELLNKSKQMNEAEIRQQKNMRNIFIAGMILMTIFVGFVIRSLRIRNKQNRILASKRKMLKNKEKLLKKKTEKLPTLLNMLCEYKQPFCHLSALSNSISKTHLYFINQKIL
jgi:hypothetical protein